MTTINKYILVSIAAGVSLGCLLHVPPSAQANAGAEDADHGATVVELFTSEGCSSCPPADALLQQIDNKTTDNGRRIIAISEHVTYWNHLGWSDPFSNDLFTERQDLYGRRFHLDSVYTPQMVIDGDEQIVGSDRTGLKRAIERTRERSALTIRIGETDRQGDSLSVSYALTGSLPAKGADLVAVIADDEDHSTVARGENSGRILTHVSVARLLKRFPAKSLGTDEKLQIQLSRAFSSSPEQTRRLILFLQEKEQGRILAADEKPL